MYEYLICISIKAENYVLKVKPGLGMEAVTPEGKPSGQACNAYSPTVKPLAWVVCWVCFMVSPKTIIAARET